MAAQGQAVRLVHFGQMARRIGPRLQPVRGPVDFGGCVIGSGRAIWLDAKMDQRVRYYEVGHKDHLRPHQREFLIRQGACGAIAGVLVWGTGVKHYFWLPWKSLVTLGRTPSIPWDSAHLVCLGPDSLYPDFRKIPGVVAVEGALAQ